MSHKTDLKCRPIVSKVATANWAQWLLLTVSEKYFEYLLSIGLDLFSKLFMLLDTYSLL